jgi:uncharacterized protein YndB with AHSA1/START domain
MEPEELRYADGPSAEVEIFIAAPAEKVWALITDITLPARFSSEFRGADWLHGATGPATGASFTGHNEHPAIGSWSTTSFIVECEPYRVLAWSVSDVAQPSAQWRFTLDPVEGGTRLTQWMRIGPGRSGLSPAIDAMPDKESKIIRRRLDEHRRNMTANLEGVKALAEAD